jgi:hypothetical protein
MCLVITINDKGVDVIDVGRLRSWINFRGSHSGTPVHTLLCTFIVPRKIRDITMPLSKRCTGE